MRKGVTISPCKRSSCYRRNISLNLDCCHTQATFTMDGIGFIATLHATTLDQQGSTPVLLKPVRRQNRSSSSGSISGRAKSLVNRSMSFFSTSSSSSTVTRTSISTSSPRSSEQGHEGFHKRSPSMLDSRSLLARSSSSRLPSEESPRSPNQPNSPSLNNGRKTRGSVKHLTAPSSRLKDRYRCSSESRLDTPLDPTWISRLVDNGYISPPESLPPTPPRCDIDIDSDIEPSRASSMLDRELETIDLDDSPRSPRPTLAPLLSLSIAEQLAISLDDQESHKPWLTDCQNLLHPELIPGFNRLAQPRPKRPQRLRPFSTAT